MEDLKLIKKHYGEKMMHLCRELFPTLLETEGLLWNILTKKFSYSKFLAEDIISENAEHKFKNLIYKYIEDKKEEKIKTNKTPKELLSEAGYNLFECNSKEEIKAFKKYYAPGEELCTFHDERLNRCHVFFAVKKNVDEIKRENFKNPKREDEYGTSVISIQFTRGNDNYLSIKNRYNHTVNNPDSTFSNNLENIIPGLTESFNKEYNLNINSNENTNFELSFYVLAKDGKYYKYNYEINNIYYCPDNIIIDNFEVKQYDKSKYIVFAYFILDLVNKKIIQYDEKLKSELPDDFIKGLENIESIKIKKDKETKNRIITINNDIVITLDKTDNLIKYSNSNLTEIGNNFLSFVNYINELDTPNIKKIGDNFMGVGLHPSNFPCITNLYLPEVEEVGNCFLCNNIIKNIYLPKLKIIGDHFMRFCARMVYINLPSVEIIGNDFMHDNPMDKVELPNVREIGDNFLRLGFDLKGISLPKLKIIGDCFLRENLEMELIDLPEVKEIGRDFLVKNKILKSINLPKVEKIGSDFLGTNIDLYKILLPNIEYIGDNFLKFNMHLKEIDCPYLKEVGREFLLNTDELEKINLPRLEKIGAKSLLCCWKLKELNIPSLKDEYNYLLSDPITAVIKEDNKKKILTEQIKRI